MFRRRRVVCWASVHKRTLTLVGGLAVSLASLVGGSPPVLAATAPSGAYGVFSQCPTSTPGVSLCTYTQITGGEIAIGNATVPIDSTITIQGGGLEVAENLFVVFPAKNGESISKTGLEVPGGLRTLVDCHEIAGKGFLEKVERHACRAIFRGGGTGLTMTIEAVANQSNPAILDTETIVDGAGPGLTLPVRVHLNSPVLGGACYIGSETSPIELHLTTGTTSPPPPNTPITGKPGVLSEEEEVLVFTGSTLLDNTFSVPTAEGCNGLFLPPTLIDPLIDTTLRLPSPAGHNTIILNNTQKIALATNVIKSEAPQQPEQEQPEQEPNPNPWQHRHNHNHQHEHP